MNRIMQLLEETPVVSSTLIDGALCLMQHIPHELMRDLRSHALLSSTSASSAAPHLGKPNPPPAAQLQQCLIGALSITNTLLLHNYFAF